MCVSLKENNTIQLSLLDLSSSFDFLKYMVLITRLKSLAIHGIALDWFKNYI